MIELLEHLEYAMWRSQASGIAREPETDLWAHEAIRLIDQIRETLGDR